MVERLFSPSWHRVGALTPRLRSHVRIHRHHYRGELWYVLHDAVSQRSHRFTPAANFIIGLMDGRRSVQEIWQLANSPLADDAPTQDEMIRLLSQLHNADALQCDVSPDTAELLRRYDRQKRASWARRFLNPMAVRVPLLDPDRFLDSTQRYVRPLFGWFGGLVWLGIVGWAMVLAGLHWSDLTENLADRVLAPHNLLLLGLMFPLVKAAHEFGHAFATKVWGGEVHEMGLMLLVLMPVPYVDASAASAFREKHRRVVVGAAGMVVELFLAALALFLWLNVEPGAVRAIAYNVILIASISTIVFNANPLLRFDGYYILADLLEIQNLGTRANKYLGYLFQRYLFGLRDVEPPPATAGERRWFFAYGVPAFVYRLFIVAAIALFIGAKFFFIGVLLACWAIGVMIVLPLGRNLVKILTSPTIRPKRARALLSCGAIAAAVVAVIALVPVPSWTRAEGVVWTPGDRVVRAGADGFIERLLVRPGTRVRRGDPLIACGNAELVTRVAVLEARLEELKTRYWALRQEDRVQAEMLGERAKAVRADLLRTEDEVRRLVVDSPADGVFVAPGAADLPGRYVRKGELLGYALDPSTATAKVIVFQRDIDLVRQRTRVVEVRLADSLAREAPATVKRVVPGATDRIPSLALAQVGGGEVALDPRERAKAFERFFLLDLDFAPAPGGARIGTRVYVRFDHGREPLAQQWYRGLRQLFLSRFDV